MKLIFELFKFFFFLWKIRWWLSLLSVIITCLVVVGKLIQMNSGKKGRRTRKVSLGKLFKFE